MEKVVLLLLAVSSSVGAEKVFYVKPTLPTTECPSGDSPCHSLQYYANHSSFTNNSRFLFLEGEHHLDGAVSIANVANLSLVGANSGVEILCAMPPGLQHKSVGVYIEQYWDGLMIENLTLSNCFNKMESSNYDAASESIQVAFSDVILVNSPLSMNLVSAIFTGCTFENNNAQSALNVQLCEITFQGSNLFRNNSAFRGGAIQLDTVHLHLQADTHILFENNHANYAGGAMYINNYIPASCFFQVYPSNANDAIKVSFINNTADFAGSSLYGSVDLCCVTESCDNFYDIFKISNTESDPTAIASDAADICPCEPGRRKPDCSSSRTYGTTIIAFPGQNFNISLAVVGSRTFGGVVSSGFYGYLNISNATLGSFQSSKVSDKHHCTNATYSLAVSTLNNPINFLHIIAANFSLLSVKVHLIDCPFGFSLSPATGNCDCDPAIDNKIITCNIDDQTFFRPATSMSWLGLIDDEPDGSIQIGVIFYPRCPIGYCSPHNVTFNISTRNDQCEPNRSGRLCGECEEIYSLTLGNHAKCVRCSNTYLLLILPFAVAGVLLVVLLFVLNLTVTEGSINGLIFYANVIGMNHTVLFTEGSSYLYVFLAWMNLDLGLNVCLYDGLDVYADTWLQFVFPVYLWLIIVVVIKFFRKFPLLANRLGGANAVKVLATLLLLSYTKLQRTIITIMSFIKLDYPNGEVRYVWLYDANVEYFKGKHLYLGIAGILVLVFLIVPYTLCLIFFQQLQSFSGHRLFHWVNKLKPVFDSYAGPYKDKYRFWTGMLLAVRTLLIVIFAISTSKLADFNLLIISIVSCALLVANTHGAYKKWVCNYLESFFYMQLIVYAVGITYARHADGNVGAVEGTSFGITLFVLLLILGYHVKCRIANYKKCHRNHQGYNDVEDKELSINQEIVERLDQIAYSQ